MKKLFHGKETFLSLLNAKKLINDILNQSQHEYLSVEASSLKPEIIIQYFSTDSIFNTPKIYLFKRFYENKEKEGVIDYLLSQSALSETNYYIFWEEQKIASNTKYYKFFFKDKAVEEINSLNKPSFNNLIKEVLKENNLKIESSAIPVLASRVNYSPERLFNEIEKYKLEGIEELTSNIIKERTTDTLENAIWDLTKYINQNDKESVFKTYENLKRQLIDPNFIIAMIARNLRLLAQVKYCIDSNITSREICSILRIPPFTLPELADSAKESNWEKIKFFYEKLASLDYEIKRGNIEADTGIVLLLSKI